mmetsp:Transcript_104058/g.335529  ORF Transcript_104058/g.335529 Transcript_104058/m.335529 type:complete len:393 (-) Transcript_104058:177-1355(-)
MRQDVAPIVVSVSCGQRTGPDVADAPAVGPTREAGHPQDATAAVTDEELDQPVLSRHDLAGKRCHGFAAIIACAVGDALHSYLVESDPCVRKLGGVGIAADARILAVEVYVQAVRLLLQHCVADAEGCAVGVAADVILDWDGHVPGPPGLALGAAAAALQVPLASLLLTPSEELHAAHDPVHAEGCHVRLPDCVEPSQAIEGEDSDIRCSSGGADLGGSHATVLHVHEAAASGARGDCPVAAERRRLCVIGLGRAGAPGGREEGISGQEDQVLQIGGVHRLPKLREVGVRRDVEAAVSHLVQALPHVRAQDRPDGLGKERNVLGSGQHRRYLLALLDGLRGADHGRGLRAVVLVPAPLLRFHDAGPLPPGSAAGDVGLLELHQHALPGLLFL